jgi:hypothetical protein
LCSRAGSTRTYVHACAVARVHTQVRHAWLAGSSAYAAAITVSPGAHAAAALKNAPFASGRARCVGIRRRRPSPLTAESFSFSRFVGKPLLSVQICRACLSSFVVDVVIPPLSEPFAQFNCAPGVGTPVTHRGVQCVAAFQVMRFAAHSGVESALGITRRLFDRAWSSPDFNQQISFGRRGDYFKTCSLSATFWTQVLTKFIF